jgi:putative Mg2+ transporter-C (MgtC) family protein
MLVALGATIFTLIASELGILVGIDTTRITAGIVTGIGFLGAGTIIQYQDSIRGLSTAASIWTVAAIGMAVGYGMYTLSIVGAVLTLLILLLEGVEKKLIK